ncbi:MAG: M48 family metalloprotease [Selenomonadaceae bacterium]|nr:M48 family metalloprotease [Selenomonadaceae bacterium]
MKNCFSLFLTLCLSLNLLLPVQTALAADAWGMAAEALGVYGAYRSSLMAILELGNNVHAQMSSRRQDLQQTGKDENPTDQKLVAEIMTELIAKGGYVLRANSLPFIWSVNSDPKLNAACYPTNYITVNRGLLKGLRDDRDEIAAVLAHEMTHGLEQHSAHAYAQAVAQYMAMSLINLHTNSTDWYSLNRLAGYSIATNISVPTETEADEGGFYLMTDAGFNPGGAAAAMARMQYYLRYETEDIYEFDTQEKRRPDQYSDHPETENREKNLAQLMRVYSAGHVSVQDRKNVFIDGDFLLAASPTNAAGDNTLENAYYIAGALAKAFHDHDSLAGWNFREASGEIDFLDDSRVYAVLKDFIKKRNAGERLREMVTLAYQKEGNGVRERLRAAEDKRRQELLKKQAAAMAASEGAVKQMRLNADAYNDYGEADLALTEIARALAVPSQDNKNLAEAYAIRGRAKAIKGDFTGALADTDRAITMDSENLYNFLNRADVYHQMGELEKALADTEQAANLDAKNAVVWYVAGSIYDDMNDRDGALAAYEKLYRLNKNSDVPMKYLKDIDPKEAERRQKIMDKAKAER